MHKILCSCIRVPVETCRIRFFNLLNWALFCLCYCVAVVVNIFVLLSICLLFEYFSIVPFRCIVSIGYKWITTCKMETARLFEHFIQYSANTSYLHCQNRKVTLSLRIIFFTPFDCKQRLSKYCTLLSTIVKARKSRFSILAYCFALVCVLVRVRVNNAKVHIYLHLLDQLLVLGV